MRGYNKLRLKRFASASRGNVSIILALSAVPMLFAGGIAMDFIRASDARTKLQSAVDAAAIAGGVTMNSSDAEVKKTVLKYLAKNGAAELVEVLDTIRVVKIDKDTFRVEAEGAIETTLTKLAGFSKLDISAKAEIKRSFGAMEVVLVLDNTYSMNGDKLNDLKSSARDLVDTVFSDTSNPNIKMGLVPFSDYVNIDLSRRNEDWLNVDDDKTETKDVCNWVQNSPSNCRTETCSYQNDGSTITYDCNVCDGDWTEQCAPQSVSYTWHGCVGSRNYPMNVDGTVPNIGDSSTLYPGLVNTWCARPLQPLTSNKGTLKSEINQMVATGNTYIPAGLEWGWNLLSHDAPFTEGVSYADMDTTGTQKVLVLMTDGDNTLSPDYPYHWGSTPSVSNGLTTELCTNIKARGITIYAISYEVASTDIDDLLRGCASNAGNYFNADSALELAEAFGEIAQKLANLRISK